MGRHPSSPQKNCSAAQWFLIPQVLEHDILPSPFLPIAKFLEFPLPLESMACTETRFSAIGSLREAGATVQKAPAAVEKRKFGL
jgi:hypothetical protein